MAIGIKNKCQRFLFGLLILFTYTNTSFALERHVIDEIGAVVTFEKKSLYRVAPSLLVLQAKQSLPHVESEVRFLCERSNGYIRGLSYSMLCYTSLDSGDHIKVLGELRFDNYLWNYHLQLSRDDLTNDLIVVIEALYKLTFNKYEKLNTASSSNSE